MTIFRRILSQAAGQARYRAAAPMCGRPVLCFALAMCAAAPLYSQTGGEAGIEGTVVDSSGATVPNATVTATNIATGIATVRSSSAAGLYTISPITPGTYTVTVTAQGFQKFKQNNFVINALQLTGLNVTLKVGTMSQEVVVTGAPPALTTTNAVLGGVIENKTYENLPLQMSGQQRDPTAFATLLPGVQSGSRAPVIGGTGNFLAAVYVDGIPVTTINQQGDNRVVSNAVPVEAIDQFQVVTSTPGAEYEGAGLINFTLKSGSDAYHGTAAIFVRNTIFDTWGFTAPALTSKDAQGNTIPAKKPVEHQNEIVGALGGPIPLTHKKGFFYVTYDKYHGRNGINPNVLTVPTTLMRQGNFSELLSLPKPINIYDPTSTAACTAQTGALCRNPYPGNVIPSDELSPLTLKMQSYLPAPTNPGLTGNYLGGVPSGFDNHEISARVDYDLTAKQRLSYVLTLGTRKNVPFTVGGSPAGVVLPLPYTAGGYATIKPTVMDIEHNYQISPSLGNQFKFGFNRFSQPVESLTDGIAPYSAAADIGITGLPGGQASTEFPGARFGTTSLFSTAETPWTSNGASGATQTTVPNTYTLLDNLLLVKGRHSLTLGAQVQWLEDNVAGQLGPSGILTIPYSADSTAPFTGTSLNPSAGGFAYASYLLGAAGQSGIAIQQVSETGGRYHDISPYIQDDWKVTPNLTLNLGLRWDYFPPFHEVEDRWSFLNPNITNAATGNMGALQFAGHRGAGVSCQCRTPVHTWMKNFGPRIGLAYSVTPTTVIRAGYALVYSIGGGVGGRAGAGAGTGSLGFNTTATTPTEQTTGAGAGPSYYLNNSAGFSGAGLANTNYGGPGYTLPTIPTIGPASQTLNTGNYETATGKYASASTIAYADPYRSSRAPEFDFFNVGIQQALTNDLTLTLNYAGTQSHFLDPSGQNARGYWTNELNPTLLAQLGPLLGSDGKTPLLTSKTTPANLAILQRALPNYAPAYSGLYAPNSTASISQALVAFPQYSGVSDVWGANVANISYNSLQASLSQRLAHGITYTINYTWSRNIGDDGTFRSGYALPAGATSNGKAYAANRIERGVTQNDIPQSISIYGVYELPFGKHGFGRDNYLVRTIAGGWQLSDIYSYHSGTPLVFTYGGCTAPNEGQCMPDLTPGYGGSPRRNGKFGKGITAKNLTAVSYIDPAAFKAPNDFAPQGAAGAVASPISKIGTAPRTAPYGLRNQASYNLDISLRRTFDLTPNRVRLVLEADGLNITNHPVFGNINTAVGSTTFGTVRSVRGNRDFQFAGRINF